MRVPSIRLVNDLVSDNHTSLPPAEIRLQVGQKDPTVLYAALAEIAFPAWQNGGARLQ